MTIGNNETLTADSNGKMAYIQAYNRILSPNEVLQLRRYPGSKLDGCVLNHPFFNSQSPAIDYSGFNNYGTVLGPSDGGRDQPPVNGFGPVGVF